jgi:DNA-binding beta-propeller fold protein YncE
MAPDGLFLYSNCMRDDQVVEIDTRTFEVSRRFSVATGGEMALMDYEVGEVVTGARGITRAAQAANSSRSVPPPPTCSPTWTEPTPDGKSVFVACNKGNEILVLDRESWTLERKFTTGPAPYNLGITPDGRILVASLKSAGQVQFFDAATGESLAIVPSSTTVTHGVAMTPDSRYAFVSVEGKGAEPGKVDVYDLKSFEMIGSAEVGQQAGGIIFWKMEPAN